jgi:bacterioferritin-associated ferredoxin
MGVVAGSNKPAQATASSNDLVVCRCEGVTLGQVKTCIHGSGARSVNQVKKLTRAGMGPCQGRTCAAIVEKILSNETGVSRGSEPYYARPPLRGIPLAVLAACADRFAEPHGPAGAVMLRPEGQDAAGRPEGVEDQKLEGEK